jgi:AraC-like DNA-binding protein
VIQTYKPKSKLLQKHIELFYVFNSPKQGNISYVAFPHVNTAISFFKGVDILRGDHVITITDSKQSKNICIVEILGKYTKPVFVNYTGNFEEVAIVFKPLGVNHFFNNALIEITPHYSQALNSALWTEFSCILFKEKNIKERIEMVELFLLNNLKEIENESLYKAIKYLEDFEANYGMDHIASLCGFTLKTFQRNFKKHLTCSPLEYKRIARFRHSLQDKLFSKEIKTLTSVSYESNYYDQSYFIREFKKMTQLRPKSFFDSISALNEKKIVWKVK